MSSKARRRHKCCLWGGGAAMWISGICLLPVEHLRSEVASALRRSDLCCRNWWHFVIISSWWSRYLSVCLGSVSSPQTFAKRRLFWVLTTWSGRMCFYHRCFTRGRADRHHSQWKVPASVTALEKWCNTWQFTRKRRGYFQRLHARDSMYSSTVFSQWSYWLSLGSQEHEKF